MTARDATLAPARWRTVVRRIAILCETTVAVSATLTILACLAVLVILVVAPDFAEEWTSGLRPSLFYTEIDADALSDYQDVFVVAHNSGDSITATLEAVDFGADVIEIDVIVINGKLYAAHGAPLTWIGKRLFRGPPLEQVWAAAAGANAIKLDLKDSSPATCKLIVQFIATHPARRVIVVTADTQALQFFAKEAPNILRFLSIGNASQFARLQSDSSVRALIDGVSIREDLIDDERAAWLEANHVLTLAWTVNRLDRMNELVDLGVDAITTDNLAIMAVLGGRDHGATMLDRARSPAVSVPPG